MEFDSHLPHNNNCYNQIPQANSIPSLVTFRRSHSSGMNFFSFRDNLACCRAVVEKTCSLRSNNPKWQLLLESNTSAFTVLFVQLSFTARTYLLRGVSRNLKWSKTVVIERFDCNKILNTLKIKLI